MAIPFYKHDLGQEELDAIAQVLKGEILTTGDTVKEFEHRFATYLGRKYALGLSSCTGALHLSLKMLDIGAGDEVITTPLTFIATSTAIIEAGARPVFVDVEPHTGNLDAARVEAAITPRTKAIVPVHLYGLMCDMPAIHQLAQKHALKIVEDSAHCVEGVRDAVRPGQLSDVACFSFYATKNLSCGEGGALVTDNEALYRKLRTASLHGMSKTAADRQKEGYSHWDMLSFGWKYNMNNIQAAMLLPQLKRLNDKLRVRQHLARVYRERLQTIPGLRLPALPENTVHANHLFPVWTLHAEQRDSLIAALQSQGIGVVVNYRPIHLLKYFRDHYRFEPGSFPQAESIGNSTLSLPFYPGMRDDEIHTVCDALAKAL